MKLNQSLIDQIIIGAFDQVAKRGDYGGYARFDKALIEKALQDLVLVGEEVIAATSCIHGALSTKYCALCHPQPTHMPAVGT